MPRGEGVLDLAALFPGEAQKGRDGGRAVEIAFSLDVPEGGLNRAFRHNDYYGDLSINGGPFSAMDGPFAGWEPTPSACDTGRMKAPAFKMVLTAVGDYAYRQPYGIVVCPFGCLRP